MTIPWNTCHHPPIETLVTCWCRNCGYWENGVKVADAHDENLQGLLGGIVGEVVTVVMDHEPKGETFAHACMCPNCSYIGQHDCEADSLTCPICCHAWVTDHLLCVPNELA